MMKAIPFSGIFLFLLSCNPGVEETTSDNPFLRTLNQAIDYKQVTADRIEAYADHTLKATASGIAAIKSQSAPTFENTFVAYDAAFSELSKAMNNCFMLYWVSPDSLSRVKGLAGYQLLDSLNSQIRADKELFEQMTAFAASGDYADLTGHRKRLADDIIQTFKLSGVGLDPEKQEQFKELNARITELSSQYSTNMNTAGSVLSLDAAGAAGLPENFKKTYAMDGGRYEIPVMPATRQPVLDNAELEATRKAYLMAYYNRGADKNLAILDSMIALRHQIGRLMGYDSYAAYNLQPKMAGNPERVWNFINDLIEQARPKAVQDHQSLQQFRNEWLGTESDAPIAPWNLGYFSNQLLKTQYQVDHEKIREYLPMEACLTGMMEIYQELLGFEFKKVDAPSVWHEEVEMYEVYEGETLRGRFYLDLFPRPNKESWFYGVPLTPGRQTEQGYEVPVNMLLGNFTRPTESLPSLLSHNELSTLFHEFGHIMDGMSYRGEFAVQSDSKSDFVEAMSQIFENWIWDYEILSSFARHYETGEVLPKDTFDKMLRARNVTSGLSALRSLGLCTYDMMLYDKYDPNAPLDTDELWRTLGREIAVAPTYVEGTHPQANWIHINTHPVYYYGYLWSEVYAQDLFTEFEKNGLLDRETGVRYRDIILANGSQRDVVEAVEEFLGRPSNNAAYIKSLGLE